MRPPSVEVSDLDRRESRGRSSWLVERGDMTAAKIARHRASSLRRDGDDVTSEGVYSDRSCDVIM